MSVITERRQALAKELLHAMGGPCRVKLCGMFREQDITAVNEAEPDFCGFITNVPSSHRSLSTERAKTLAREVGPGIFTVGVYVDDTDDRVARDGSPGYFDVIQLHGEEDEGYIERVRSRTDAPIIQAFQVRREQDVWNANKSTADMVLLDSGQGTGREFDWSLLASVERPFILAGGLTPENVGQVIRELRPWGVDMSSGLETDRVKDPEKIRAAVAAVRSANNA
ncbi:MAG: phosphoribosylanthranilate isomerase [Olsenella sp.]